MKMIQSKKMRLLSFLLALMMVLPLALTACGGSGDGGEGTTAATTAKPSGSSTTSATTDMVEIIDPEVEEWVEIYDMGVDGGARQINFLTDVNYNTNYYFFRHEQDDDVLAGDTLAQSALTRTLYIEEQFNVAFNPIQINNAQIFGLLQSSVGGSGGEYDMVYPHPTSGMMSILASGLYQNLYTFDEIDLSKPWWNQSQVHEFSVGDKLYIGVNNTSICGQGFLAMVYNRTLYNTLQLTDDPYTLVYDGEWTMAKLAELAMKFGEGAGEDGVLNEKDNIGFVYEYNPYWASGGRVISKDDNGEFYIAIDEDQATQIAQEFYKLIWETEDHVWIGNGNAPTITYATFASLERWASFKASKILFWHYDLGGLYKHLWTCDFDIGYLPAPKVNSEQADYHSVISAGFFAIPQKVKDNKVSATLLESLAIHSYTYHRKNFFENILLSRMSENPEDYQMLSFLHDTKTFDWGSHLLGINNSGDFITMMVIEQHSNVVSGIIKGRKKSWNKLLDQLEEIRNGEFDLN